MRIGYKKMLVVLTMIVLSIPAIAQNNTFKASLLSPLVRTGSFFYERTLNDDTSLQMGVFYTGASFGETTFRGIGLTPEYRYYLSSNPAPHGIFIAPYARYQNFNLSADGTSDKASYSSIGGGLLVGAQTILKNVVSLEAFIGPSYSSGKVSVDSGNEDRFDVGNFDGFGIRFGIAIGVAF